jgi:PKD repeat protein
MTSKILKIVTCLLLLCLVGGGMAASAEEATQLLPMFLTGKLFIGEKIAPPGTIVYADVVGIDGGFATVTSDGVYGDASYPMMVQVGANETLRGSPVTFWVNGVQADETATYQDGLTLELDLHVSGAAENKLTVVPRGGNVFIGEESLDVSLFIKPGDTIGWWPSASNLNTDSPAATVVVTTPKSFFINPAQFVGNTGNWYLVNGGIKNPDLPDLIVQEPSISLRVWNQNENQDINENGGKIPAGNFVNFQIETNIYPVISERGQGLPEEELGIINLIGSSNVTKVTYQNLRGSLSGIPDKDIPLRKLVVDTNKWFWPENDKVNSGWNTGAIATDGVRLYPNGEYLFRAEVNLNNIIKNYPHVGKAFSADIPSTIVDDAIDVVINPETLFRNGTFFVTVGGRPGKDYIISIMECPISASAVSDCGVLKMTGAACDRPPMIRPDQSGVTDGKIAFDTEEGPFSIGDTELATDCCGRPGTIRSTVPTDDKPNAKDVLYNGIYYYAQITTDGDNEPTPGYRTVEFNVGSDVAPDRSYRIHVQSVEADPDAMITGDELVKVDKGTVTLDVQEQAPFYLGDSITLKGTNTDSRFVYLFMTGSNCQNKCGNDLLYIKKADPANHVVQPFMESVLYGCMQESEQFTAIEVPVKSDGTWEYVWKTANVPINPGKYTIHASSIPINACCIECTCAAVATTDISLDEPCFDATIDPEIITRPVECCPSGCEITSLDKVILEGVACGFPHTGSGLNRTNELNMWIFGDEKVGNDKYVNAMIPVFDDDSFKINLLDYMQFCDLKPGTYTVILQHPMYNHKFDLLKETDVRTPVDPNQIWLVSSYPVEWSKLFPLDGPGYYQGSQAVNEIRKFDGQRLIDDKFFYLTFTIVDDRVPTAAFTASPLSGNKPLEVQFTDMSTGEGLTSWAWSFGDKTISTEQNPLHTYSEAGVYSVSLEVLNSNGDKDAITKPDYITVKDSLIKADFIGSPTSGAAPLKVQFTDRSTGSPSNWFWDFGDGYTSAGVKDPSHTYQFGGKYTVTLSVTLGEEVDRMVKKDYITVVGGPQPTITPSPLDPTKIQLYSGWNFISVARPLADADANASTVFRNVPTGGHAIWSYDPFGQFWDQVLTGTKIEPLFGYWIYSVTPNTINLTFKNDPVQIPAQRSLPNGWAAVGFTGASPATAKDTFSSVKNSWIYARGFDNARQQWEPTLVNGGQGENTYLYPSKGYWLYMETAGTLAAIGV